MRGSDFESIDNYQSNQDAGIGSVDDFGDNNRSSVYDNQEINQGRLRDTSVEDKQALQTARGITATNPYGYNNPFQGIADFFGVDVGYNSLNRQGDMNDIAEIGYKRYVNPMNNPDLPEFNPNKLSNQGSASLNKGFGSLFGSSEGEQTQAGIMREQRPDALSGTDTLALNAFSLLGGGLPSLFANLTANPSTYIPDRTDQYQPSRDPMNNQYDAETYDKGYIASTIDTMFGEGTTKQTTTIVDEAIDFLMNAGKPSQEQDSELFGIKDRTNSFEQEDNTNSSIPVPKMYPISEVERKKLRPTFPRQQSFLDKTR